MTLGRRENFHFEQSAMYLCAAAGITDGTTGTQFIDGGNAYHAPTPLNGNVPLPTWAFCEPEQLETIQQRSHVLDNLTRLLIFAFRNGGTGTWTGRFDIRRGGANPNIETAFAIPDRSQGLTVIAIDDPLPADALKSNDTTETLTDLIQCRFRVSPGSADAVPVSCFAVLAPGFVVSQSNKGANLSRREFLPVQL